MIKYEYLIVLSHLPLFQFCIVPWLVSCCNQHLLFQLCVLLCVQQSKSDLLPKGNPTLSSKGPCFGFYCRLVMVQPVFWNEEDLIRCAYFPFNPIWIYFQVLLMYCLQLHCGWQTPGLNYKEIDRRIKMIKTGLSITIKGF